MEAMARRTYDGNRGSRFTSRVFALLALAVVTVVLVAVISNTLGGSSTSSTQTSQAAAPSKPKPKDDYYVVQANDTFSAIAAKEHVSVARLIRLNQGRAIDPQVLQPNQCVNVKPDGCKKLASGG
jgi:LysM repeat protein